jgi:hypothetical protein
MMGSASHVYSFQVTGKQMLGALENGVSHYPALEGRFPQVWQDGFWQLVYCKVLPIAKCKNMLQYSSPPKSAVPYLKLQKSKMLDTLI